MAGNYIKIFSETFWDKYEISKVLEKKDIQFCIVPDKARVPEVVLSSLEADPQEIQDTLRDVNYGVLKLPGWSA